MRVNHQGRRGSILATSLGITTVFLTLMIGSMAYVSSAGSISRNDRLRAAAEDAARTGLEMVLGWADQSIDRLNKLPQEWEELDDGQTFDPVRVMQPDADVVNLQDAAPGKILGNRIHEMVVGVQKESGAGGRPRFVTSFKARIQQFRISENMPRQYLVGVAGRVRQVRFGANTGNNNDVDASERRSIKVERVILATLGKEPTSRYAALTDIDLIRNWVPGEVISGPVHINRGYVDQPPFLLPGTPGDIANPGITRSVQGQPFRLRDVRSSMDLAIADTAVPGNPGFQEVGGVKAPVFRARVTMTEILQGDPNFPNFDPQPGNTAFSMVNANGRVWLNSQTGVGTYSSQIFTSSENGAPSGQRYGPGIRGPEPLDRPIQLPRSVRDSVGAATGMTALVMQDADRRNRWRRLSDGLYIPTRKFWGDQTNHDQSYDNSPVAGGIYVRGNVEHLRITVDGPRTGYLFQVASITTSGTATDPAAEGTTTGLVTSATNFQRRCYLVVADRDTGGMRLWAWPQGQTLYGNILTGNSTLASLITLANGGAATNPNPASWSVHNTQKVRATFVPRGGNAPAFNGVIFVDPCRDDPAFTNAARRIATTGHILNLGNPYETVGQRRLNGHSGEVISTEMPNAGTGTPRPAGKLTIMARGSIFIQNHLLVQSVYTSAANPNTPPYNPQSRLNRDNLRNLRLTNSSDLLGLVSDQQVVVGLRAPSNPTRGGIGVAILGSISALGDPAWRPWAVNPSDSLDPIYFQRPRRYVGSFTTEGLMQLQGNFENYWVLNNAQGLPVPTNATWNETDANTPGQRPMPTNLHWNSPAGLGRGFPGHYEYGRLSITPTTNPNANPRGRLLVFGSITVKKRGILGSGNTSYDKDFIFDQRLLTLAPPIFPASVNLILKTQMPFTPDESADRLMPYRGNPRVAPNGGALSFMDQRSDQ
ncbi:MAG: hypothetical protein VKN33_07965 [Candidatus Sericytochromatia bacterium]|nr:hypothetical protein [Candidatus Sericytochromatia bacterium]